jgi:hypothetical protein
MPAVKAPTAEPVHHNDFHTVPALTGATAHFRTRLVPL